MTDPFTPDTIRLGNAIEELDEQAEQLHERLANADADNAQAAVIRDMARNVDRQGAGVAWLIEEYGADAEVVVKGLDAGDVARVEDRKATHRAQKDAPGGTPGSDRIATAAAGLVDAPFFEGDDHDLNDKITAIASGKPAGVAEWLAALVNDRTSIYQHGPGAEEGNWTSFSERVLESD